MSGKKKQLFRSWFCRIEHEIMLPFVTVGILVVCAFCAISVYNGYTEKFKDRKEYARTTIRGMALGIGALGAESRPERINLRNCLCEAFAVELSGNGEICGFAEEILCEIHPAVLCFRQIVHIE